jgi:hypothetical protein
MKNVTAEVKQIEASEGYAQTLRFIPVPQIWILLPTEYVDEAEHQDGSDYWLNFSTEQELIDDVNTYFESI